MMTLAAIDSLLIDDRYKGIPGGTPELGESHAMVALVMQQQRQAEPGCNTRPLRQCREHIALPVLHCLRRIRYTTTQTALDRSERTENLHNAFRLRKNADVRGLRMLLIDDVLTTGSTLSECARVLKRAGAKSVHAATAARA